MIKEVSETCSAVSFLVSDLGTKVYFDLTLGRNQEFRVLSRRRSLRVHQAGTFISIRSHWRLMPVDKEGVRDP